MGSGPSVGETGVGSIESKIDPLIGQSLHLATVRHAVVVRQTTPPRLRESFAKLA
jgi:hypothetical protein